MDLDMYQDVIYAYNKGMDGFEANFYKRVLSQVPIEILRKYNYKICYFLDFYDMPESDIACIHPYVFYTLWKNFHLLPYEIVNNMTQEQIYATIINKGTRHYIPITILLKWIDFDYSFIDEDYCKNRNIPFRGIDCISMLNLTYNSRKKITHRIMSLKNHEFYSNVGYISSFDLYVFLLNKNILSGKSVSKTLSKIDGLKNCLSPNKKDFYDYKKVIEWLNQNYLYRKVEKIEPMLDLKQVAQKYVYSIHHDKQKMKKVLLAFTNLTSNLYKHMPRIELDKGPGTKIKNTFFYDDVLEYIEKKTF